MRHTCTDDPRDCAVCRLEGLLVVRVVPLLRSLSEAFDALPDPLKEALLS